jgi:lysozyme
VFRRLLREEGERIFAYDDATGQRVRAPQGNLTWGRGFNLDACGSSRLFDVMERELITQCEGDLTANLPWYPNLDSVRQSVLLDVAYNAGVPHLLGFQKMLASVSTKDWQGARDQLLDSAAARQLPNRYGPLAQMLLTGVSA